MLLNPNLFLKYMPKLPKYIGPSAFGIKLPLIQPGDNIENIVCSYLKECNEDELLKNNSIACITESIVARAQDNYVTLDDIANDVSLKLNLNEDSRIGVLFPIASRNRFSLILKGIAKAVPKGEVYVQFPLLKDEVGNVLTDHPITGINYVKFYEDIIKQEGPLGYVKRKDDYKELVYYDLDGIVVSSIHTRKDDLNAMRKYFQKCITLQDICNETTLGGSGWSEWGVLGSNLSEGKLKLAPRESTQLSLNIQRRVKDELGKNIEVMVYGDGAYKDPSTGIYELADPVVSFGNTPNLEKPRTGVKYKYFADKGISQGLTRCQIEEIIKEESRKQHEAGSMAREGTTPRPLKDIAGTLADLVSGSSDAGTPLVIINGLYNGE